MSFLLFCGLWRSQAFYFSVILIWVYIVLVGFPASGIRAGVMATILLLSQKLGRQNTNSRTIIMAGAVMLFLNPLLLLYDAGFQFSFLAALGIIYLNSLFNNLFNFVFKFFLKIKTEKPKQILSMLSTTFSAQVFTLPLMAYSFGNISLVSPITNLLILPIVEPLMIFGFISVFVGAMSNFLGFILSFPCQILLIYFTKVIDIFSQPWAIKTMQDVSFVWLAVSYFLIGIIVRFLNKKLKPDFL
jgi:competence protein ComEC